MKLKEIVRSIMVRNREKRFKNVAISNTDVTILANNCVGRCMYHDLGLQCLSPTVNLLFGCHGYIDFVNHLDEYADADLSDTGKTAPNPSGKPFLVGLLRKDGLPDVEVVFGHYRSFEEAKTKWFERYPRINYDKIFLVITAMAEHEHTSIDEYTALPYPKIIFTDLPSDPERSIIHMNICDKSARARASLVNFVNFWGKRGYDEFNFVDGIFNRDYTK